MVYEGEQEGAAFVANQLISEAIKTLFLTYFPKIEKLKKTFCSPNTRSELEIYNSQIFFLICIEY
jgi:hypothetical protein